MALELAVVALVLVVGLAIVFQTKINRLEDDLIQLSKDSTSNTRFEMYSDRQWEIKRELDALYEATGYTFQTTKVSKAVKKGMPEAQP